jgi:hypothetical protein
VPPQLRQLLIDRFHLAAHRDTREMPIYRLVLARSDRRLGPSLTHAASDGCAEAPRGRGPSPPSGQRRRCVFRIGNGSLIAASMSMATLASRLKALVGRFVDDETGLDGLYDFEMKWLPPDGASAAGRRATAEEMAQVGTIADSAATAPPGPAMTARVADALRRLPFVAAAYTDSALVHDAPADSFAVLERRSLYPGRAAAEFSRFGVEVRYAEGWLPNVRGTGHGTPYWYDRHVPVVFMGRGIAPGRDSARVATVDVAPTLAGMLGVATPPDLDGKVLPVRGR